MTDNATWTAVNDILTWTLEYSIRIRFGYPTSLVNKLLA